MENENDCERFWKFIRKVISSDKAPRPSKSDIILHNEGYHVQRDKVAHFINNYFGNIGNVQKSANESVLEGDADADSDSYSDRGFNANHETLGLWKRLGKLTSRL